ncbi:MAG: peptidase E [Chitinophagaceae bacterium]|nr:MAG: peptidase E [Chitinophagaceae bacterium]
MKLLLTSAGFSNKQIYGALEELMGKPVSEATAFFVPTAIYGIRGGGEIVAKVITGTLGDPFCNLGWKSFGLLELTALSTQKKEIWLPALEAADVLLVGGGDCQYLTYWLHESGLAELLPVLLQKLVYVGLSAGSMIMTKYGTTYGNHTLPPETPKSLGLLDFAIHPHLDHEWFPDNALPVLEKLAAGLPFRSYLIDDQTAILVVDDKITVISAGNWKLVEPG